MDILRKFWSRTVCYFHEKRIKLWWKEPHTLDNAVRDLCMVVWWQCASAEQRQWLSVLRKCDITSSDSTINQIWYRRVMHVVREPSQFSNSRSKELSVQIINEVLSCVIGVGQVNVQVTHYQTRFIFSYGMR